MRPRSLPLSERRIQKGTTDEPVPVGIGVETRLAGYVRIPGNGCGSGATRASPKG